MSSVNSAFCTPHAPTFVARNVPLSSVRPPRKRSARPVRACEQAPETLVQADTQTDAPTTTDAFVHQSYVSSVVTQRPSSARRAADELASALPTEDVPGPTPLPIVGNALDIVGTPLSQLMLTYANRYGQFLCFSIVKDVLFLVSNPEDIARINRTNSRNYLDRWTPPGFETLLYEGKLKGLVFSQSKYWMQHRQIVGSIFRSAPFLNHYVDTTVDKTRFILDSIWASRDRQIINVHQQMRMLTLDIIGSAAFGAEFGAMTSPNGSHEIEQCLSKMLHGVFEVIQSPLPLWRVMNTPGRAVVKKNLHRLQTIEKRLISDRRKQLREENRRGDNSKKDLLGMLLRARDDDTFVNFKDEDLMWDCHDVIFAGHETTASALAATIFLVAGSPRVLSKIREELQLVLPDGRAPTLKDLDKLVYLEMTLNEALRLYPPTALVGRIAKDEDVLSGYKIPAGSNVLMSPYVMGRLESLWKNAEEFKPERFAPELVETRHPMVHIPFGAGPRVCLGSRMAMMEAKAVLALMFRKYSFERIQNHLEVDYDSTVSFKSGMDMFVHRIS